MLNINIWARLMRKFFGQFGINWSISGQTPKKIFTAKRLKYFSKQKCYSETRINLQSIYGARFLI
jgi:hypothetical protein